MSKRKCNEMMICLPCKSIYNKKIFVIDNHIYFYSIIDDENMKIFGDYVNELITTYNFDDREIYIHINSVGGYLNVLMKYVEIFNIQISNNPIKLISIIEHNVNNCAIIFAGLCDNRVFNKNAKMIMHKLTDNYWYFFKQCNNNSNDITVFRNDLINILVRCSKDKLDRERAEKIIDNGGEWNCKKCKKLGLIDIIV